MNVLILSDLIVYSGVGQYIVQLGGYIAKETCNTVVLASSKIVRTDIPKDVIVVNLPSLNNVLNYLKSLDKIIKRYKIDVVHCNHRKQTFMIRLYQFVYGKIPTVWTCHTVPYPNNWIKRLLGYYGHKSIAISSEAYNWMQKELHIEQSKIDKIINGVDNNNLVFSPINKFKLKEHFFEKYFNERLDDINIKIIVAHGRLHPIKGLDLLIEAYAKLHESLRQNTKLVISGDINVPYYSELISLIKKYQISNSVYFTGWIASSEIFGIADLMVQPSHREGFPLAVIEAFLMKVPVIRTKVGGYEDMKDCCIGIPVNNINAIYHELKNWISNSNSLETMVEKAYQFAIDQGTIKAMSCKTIETYKRAIKLCQS